jgi:phospholipase C
VLAAGGFLGSDLGTVTGADGPLSGTVSSPLAEPRRLALTGLLAFVLAAATFAAALVMNTAPPRPYVAGGAPGSGSGQEEMPAGLQAAVERARYAIVPDQAAGVPIEGLTGGLQSQMREPAYVAENPGQGLAARFTAAGVTLGPGGRKAVWHSRLHLTGVGYGAHPARPPPPALFAAENRIELRRGALTEWYVNERRGLEQGFTLRSPPARKTGGPLVLQMTVAGDLRPDGDRSGGLVSLVDRSRKPVLGYGELHAYDAAGRTVPARMSANGKKLSLVVEDAGAAYPLTIDPLVSQAKLTPPASAAAARDTFGWSVAVSGDTALVGVPGADTAGGTEAGAAYVFVRSGTSWSMQQKLTAPDGAASDNFGLSVALSGDTALIGIGSPLQNPGPGAAYVFVRSGTSWSFQQKLTAPDGVSGDRFGQSVALDGDTALVGAMSDDNVNGTDAGSAYVFTRSGTSWSLQQQLVAPDGTLADLFGSSVALSGDTALVGARLGDTLDGGSDAGSAYVFVRNLTSWSFQQKLTAADGEGSDGFGWSVALSGDTAVVGAPLDNTSAGTDAGSAYVFVRTLTSWSFQQQLTASGAASNDQFGQSVAVIGDTALVGAPGGESATDTNLDSAYAFTRTSTSWSLQQKLTASDGQKGDQFGSSVALSSDTALVGARLDDTAGVTDAGSAYVFNRSGSSWSLQQKLQLAEGALPRDGFGRSVALSGDTALVGSPNDDTIAGNSNAGTAYVFTRSGTSWSLQERLTASDARASDNFGTSVALDGDTALVGSPGDDNAGGADAGSAYAFIRSGTTWSLQQKLTQPDGAAGDGFGRSVRLSFGTALVGAPGDDTSTGTDAGSAHVFIRSGTSWSFQRRLSRGAAGDRFGSSLGLSSDTALVGAPGDDTSAGTDAGSAHVFVRSGTSWSFQRTLSAPAGAAADGFGGAADLSGDTALVGAPADDTAAGTDAGSADVFVRSGTSWSLQKQLTAGDGAASDNFGSSVALSIDRALVGAPLDDSQAGTDAGSAYSFTRSGTSWSLVQKLTAGDATKSDRFGSSVAQSVDTFLIGAPQDGPNRQAPGAAYVFVDQGNASPIQHVVVIYQENHSFDNVLGRWCVTSARCDGTTQGKLPDGTTVPLRTATDLVPAMPHTTVAQRTAINGGLMDGFANLSGCGQQSDYACLSQFGATQIPNLIGLATSFAVSDRTFQLSNVPSFGSHIELVAATLDGFTGDIPHTGTAGTSKPGWGCDSLRDADWLSSDGTVIKQPACIPDYSLDSNLYPYGGAYKPTQVQPAPTIMDELDQAGLSWKHYTGLVDGGTNSGYLWAICPTFAQCLYTAQHANQVDHDQVIQDAANGTLPNFSVVLPNGPNSQHNTWSMATGDNWIGQVVGAIESGPDWDSTAIFITYDDCGCFYDHVPPPPGFGIRTPMVIVSPWVKPGYTDSTQASYASPLAFTEHIFGLAPLSNRDSTAYDYGNTFDFSQQPLAPVQMTTTKLSRSQILRVRNAPHDNEGT